MCIMGSRQKPFDLELKIDTLLDGVSWRLYMEGTTGGAAMELP